MTFSLAANKFCSVVTGEVVICSRIQVLQECTVLTFPPVIDSCAIIGCGAQVDAAPEIYSGGLLDDVGLTLDVKGSITCH